MKPIINSINAMVLLGLLIFTGTSSAGTVQDYASFDRAFIPPLAITQQEQVKPSKKAMAILLPAWNELKGKYYHASASDDALRKDFDKIEAQIAKAQEIVDSGQNLVSAHEALESVRYTLQALRQRSNISYYPDILTNFHEYMEEITHSAGDVSPADLDENAVYALKEALQEALNAWKAVQQAPFNPAEYGFNDQQAGMREKLLVEETAALKKLEDAIAAGDKEKIISAAAGIKPKYAAQYKLFGDFDKVVSK